MQEKIIYGTGKSKHMPLGMKTNSYEPQASYLVEKGYASFEPVSEDVKVPNQKTIKNK